MMQTVRFISITTIKLKLELVQAMYTYMQAALKPAHSAQTAQRPH